MQSTQHLPPTPARCPVCGGGSEHPLVPCHLCVHPDRVRTYCSACKARLDGSLAQMKERFLHTMGCLEKSGVTVRFDACPSCNPDPTKWTIEIFEPIHSVFLFPTLSC